MDQRKLQLLELRPKLFSSGFTGTTGDEERFQNETIRPIIKFQKDLFIEVFRNYVRKHKNSFLKLKIEERLLYVENAIQKDIKFRNSLKGMILGQFTLDEYQRYTSNSSALNKRMMGLVKDCLQENIQLLEGEVICQ